MSRRVTTPPKRIERAEGIGDAVAITLSESGRIDLGRVAELLGTNEAEATAALSGGEKPRAFFDPEENRWEPADLYLSGLVRRKLHAATAAGLEKNITALQEVLPPDWEASQITPNIGSTWIPPAVYAGFIKHLGYSNARVSHSPVTNTFSVWYDGGPSPQWATSSQAHEAGEIVSRLLNSQSMKVVWIRTTIKNSMSMRRRRPKASRKQTNYLTSSSIGPTPILPSVKIWSRSSMSVSIRGL